MVTVLSPSCVMAAWTADAQTLLNEICVLVAIVVATQFIFLVSGHKIWQFIKSCSSLTEKITKSVWSHCSLTYWVLLAIDATFSASTSSCHYHRKERSRFLLSVTQRSVKDAKQLLYSSEWLDYRSTDSWRTSTKFSVIYWSFGWSIITLWNHTSLAYFLSGVSTLK